MNIYHQLIENPLFFKWIYHPSPEVNKYWDHFLKEHAEDAELIFQFKAGFQKHLSYSEHSLTEQEKKQLALQIIHQLDENDKKRNKLKVIRMMLRYAAVAVSFLLIGSGVTYYSVQLRDQNKFASFPPPLNMNIQEPTLILDDKEEVALHQGESSLEYSAKGEIIVDKDKIVANDENNPVKMNTVVIPYGNHSKILLSDGTKVWLNAGSRLIYPSRFVDKTREVFLIGEAFFDVSKNEKQPFIVKTPDIQIKVLGTQFNMSAYPDDNIVQTVLIEGSVEVGLLNSGIFDRDVQLEPGQLANFNKQNKNTNVYNVDTDYYISWKQGYLSFYNSDLSRVVKKLERYFDVRFRYENPMNGTIHISGKLDINKDKEMVFEYMNTLTGLNFTKINDKYYVIK